MRVGFDLIPYHKNNYKTFSLENQRKEIAKSQSEKLEVIQLPEDKNKINIFNRNVKYLKTKDIKRSYSKLIQDFCAGKITGDDARTVAYLFSGYLQLIRDHDFEERLAELERTVHQ